MLDGETLCRSGMFGEIIQMRITGGQLRGSRVQAPAGATRPAMDRMRESLFAVLGDLRGCTVLDLFSGSGILALEALSRGAVSATLVERSRQTASISRSNLALSDRPTRLLIMPVEHFVARADAAFALVFVDPPFAYRYKHDLLNRIARSAIVTAKADDETGDEPNDAPTAPSRLIIHHPSHEALPEQIGILRRYDLRRYGGSSTTLYWVIGAS